MTDFKVGDAVATIFAPWQKCIVAKVKPDKIKLAAWSNHGLWARFFPIFYVTLPTAFVVAYVESGPGCCVPAETKPPVSDPVAPEVQPL